MKIVAPVERIIQYLKKKVITSDNEYTTPLLTAAIEDAYERLIAPAIERETAMILPKRQRMAQFPYLERTCSSF